MVIKKEKEILKKRTNKTGLNKTTLCAHFSLGFIWFALLVFTLTADPIILALKSYTKVTNGSFVHEVMMKEMEGIFIKVYLFNVTNAQEFMEGQDHNLTVQEVGPFVYKEIRNNIDIVIDTEAERLLYTPNIRLEFVPEGSIGRPQDINITMPNIPMLGTASKMVDYPYLTRLGFNVLTSQLNSKPVVSLDAYNYLWGYTEPLVSLSHKLMPGAIHFDKMGILDRIYDPNKQTRVEISIADEDKYMIKSLNGYKHLGMSEDVDPDMCYLCNSFENAYEGAGYRPDMDPDFPINLYRIGLCRIFQMDFNGTKAMDYGADAMVYTFNDNFFVLDPNITYGGVLPLPECFLGVPLAVSKAHFIDADPSFYERIDGINPDPDRFKSWITVDPRIGLQLETVVSLQLNLVVGDVSFNSQAQNFAEMVLPIMYLQIEQAPLPEESKMFLRGVYHTGPWLLCGAQFLFLILLIINWGFFARALYRHFMSKDDKAMSFPLGQDNKEISANSLGAPLMGNTQIPELS